MIRLRHLAEINPATPQFDRIPDDKELPFAPLEAVWPGGVDLSRSKLKSEASTGYTRFLEGDILVPKITPTFEANRSTIASDVPGGVAAGTTELHVVRVGEGADVRFIRYLLSSKYFLSFGEASMVGVAGQKRIPDQLLRDLPVQITDLAEQRAIADYLDRETARIDALIAAKQRMGAAILGRFGRLCSKATAATASVAPDAGWRRVALRRCFRSIDYGISESTGSEGTVGVLGMGDIAEGAVVRRPSGFVNGVDSGLLLSSGDLLFNRTNSLALVGKVAMVRDLDAPTTFASYLVRLRVSDLADAAYLNYLLNTDELLSLARSMALPSIGQANLNPQRYSEIRVWLPDISEQRRRVRSLDDQAARTQAIRDALGHQVEVLLERRHAVIADAVSGQLQIPAVAV